MKKEYIISLLLVGVIVDCMIFGIVIGFLPDEIYSFHYEPMYQFGSTLYFIESYINQPLANIFQFAFIGLTFWVVIMLRYKIRSTVWKLEDHI